MSTEIKRLLAMTEDELCELFARDANLLGVSLAPHSAASLRSSANTWIREHLPQLREAICKNDNVQKFCRIPPNEETKLHVSLAVAEVLGHQFKLQPGITPLAVLLVKSRIEKLCSSFWSDGC